MADQKQERDEGVRFGDPRPTDILYPPGKLSEIGLSTTFGKVYEFWPFTSNVSHIRGHFPDFDRETVLIGFNFCLDSFLRTNSERGIQLPFDPRKFKQFLKLRVFSLDNKRICMVLPSDSCPEELTMEPVGGSILFLMCRRLGITKVFKYYGIPIYFDPSVEATLQDALDMVNGLTKGPKEELEQAEKPTAEFQLPSPLATKPETKTEASVDRAVEVPPSPDREKVRRERTMGRMEFFQKQAAKFKPKGKPKAVQKLLPLPRRITRQRAKDLGIQVTDKLL